MHYGLKSDINSCMSDAHTEVGATVRYSSVRHLGGGSLIMAVCIDPGLPPECLEELGETFGVEIKVIEPPSDGSGPRQGQHLIIQSEALNGLGTPPDFTRDQRQLITGLGMVSANQAGARHYTGKPSKELTALLDTVYGAEPYMGWSEKRGFYDLGALVGEKRYWNDSDYYSAFGKVLKLGKYLAVSPDAEPYMGSSAKQGLRDLGGKGRQGSDHPGIFGKILGLGLLRNGLSRNPLKRDKCD